MADRAKPAFKQESFRPLLVTGANGFVGAAVVSWLVKQNLPCYVLLSRPPNALWRHKLDHPYIRQLICPELDRPTDLTRLSWLSAELRDCQAILHLAGFAHHESQQLPDHKNLFRLNADLTEALAHQAVRADIEHMILVSTIGVLGDRTVPGQKMRDNSPEKPVTLYGKSKLAGEKALMSVCLETGLTYTILRPPLIYGPHARGHIHRLLRAITAGIPLPVPRHPNRRSMINVHNLVSVLLACVGNMAARNQCFVVSDNSDLSTQELITKLAQALDKEPNTMPVPANMLKLAGRILRKRGLTSHICDNLEVDCQGIQKSLGWRPSFDRDEGLRETAICFQREQDMNANKSMISF